MNCGHHVSCKLSVFPIKEANDQSRESLQCYTFREHKPGVGYTKKNAYHSFCPCSFQLGSGQCFPCHQKDLPFLKEKIFQGFFSNVFQLNAMLHPHKLLSQNNSTGTKTTPYHRFTNTKFGQNLGTPYLLSRGQF